MDHQQHPDHTQLGFVVIGRNEGDRLKTSLRAIKALSPQSPVVYVDSGSTDDSVAFARSIEIEVVELDLSIPFTAARARNAGFERLLEIKPNLEFTQFLDGDCELLDGWIDAALTMLNSHEDIAIVSGRRKEKFKEASIYNALMDIEWNTPVGEIKAVPGDMCVKTKAFRLVGGFSEDIIAAEDDDLCIRIRAKGFKVYRVDADMTLHDANIMHLSQWYKRSKRGGHGYANINHLHGKGPDKYFRKELKSVAFWGGLIPTLFLLAVIVAPKIALVMLLIYSAFILKTILRRLKQGYSLNISFAYGFLIYTGKIPEFFGILQYWKNHLLSNKHQLIEYK